jgi:uncharacterized damage-inducible protein DinB
MTLARDLLAEFEEQVPVTRSFLERLPVDRLTWKPHEKSMSAGQLALHLAVVPGNVIRLMQHNPAQTPDFRNAFPQPTSVRQILEAYEASVGVVRSALPKFDDAVMQDTWRLVDGDKELFTTPRGHFLRNIKLNHWYQHRGQFSVYLRILDVAVPASWGPSADEPPLFLQKAQSA